MPQGSESSLRAAYALYSKVKCKYVVIKLGARGAFVYDGKHFDMIPAYRPDKVVDTTAAGDTFTAALTLEYLRNGANISGAVKYGAAAAAISVSRKGASVSIPTADEVAEFMAKKSY
jgi:ribokinase